MSGHDAAEHQHLLKFSLSFIMSPVQAGQKETAKKLCMLILVGDTSHVGRAVAFLGWPCYVFALLETMGDSYLSHCMNYLIFNLSCWTGRTAIFISIWWRVIREIA